MTTFQAFRVFETPPRIEGRVVEAALDELTAGTVVIKTEWSSVNYKDALAATGAGRIIRQFPLIAGIDAAGTVASSADSRFGPGEPVLVTGFELGVSHDGGFSECVRVPADWVLPVPRGLSTFEAMAIGTAGFTAALSIIRLEQNGLEPSGGPVIVTGATGGVGSLAVQCLAALGYEVTAVTGKDGEHDYLRSLGARHVLARSGLQIGTRPLEKATWAGAIDPVGGDMLAWLTRTMKYRGSIAASGLTGGTELHTTVLPFILRGVNLLGIDSAMCPIGERQAVWGRLATDMKPARLDSTITRIGLADLPGAFSTLLEGKARGRFIVRIS